jgi:2-methylcitrate dehydratase PrpD
VSTFLAAEGYEGPLTIFEGKHGFCSAMSAEPRPELIVDGLGQRFALLESGLKVHSTCGMVFNTLDAVLQARAAGELGPDVTTPIRVGVPEWLTREEAFGRRRPKTGGQARFSIPYSVATALVDGHVGPAQMREDRLSRSDVLELEDLVQIYVDDEAEDIFQRTRFDPFFFYPAALEYDHGGSLRRILHVNPRGYDTRQALTADEVVDKFVSTVDTVIAAAPARRFATDLMSWHGGDAVAEVTAELVTLAGWKP